MSPHTPFGDVTGFRRDILVALAVTEGGNGKEQITYLEDAYGEEITHTRFYSEVEKLIARGWVEKGNRNDRSNEYWLTESGQAALQADADWRTIALE